MGGVRVWRVEDANGKGPYHQADRLGEVFGRRWDVVGRRNPNHGNVNIADDKSGIYFVFLSKRELLDWFDMARLKTLIQLGYRVRSCVVKEVVLGNKQGFVRKLVWEERRWRR